MLISGPTFLFWDSTTAALRDLEIKTLENDFKNSLVTVLYILYGRLWSHSAHLLSETRCFCTKMQHYKFSQLSFVIPDQFYKETLLLVVPRLHVHVISMTAENKRSLKSCVQCDLKLELFPHRDSFCMCLLHYVTLWPHLLQYENPTLYTEEHLAEKRDSSSPADWEPAP